MPSLFVFAEIKPKPEFMDVAYAAILGIVEHTRQEEGCFQFNIFRDKKGTAICLFEEWQDESALEHHYQMDYTQTVFSSYQTWLTCEPHIIKMEKLS